VELAAGHLSNPPTHPCSFLLLLPAGCLQITDETEEVIKMEGEGDSTKELFPLKMRDAAQAAGFAYIKSKGLIPEEDSDDYIPVSDAPAGLDDCLRQHGPSMQH
jgi:hypothetical protein